MRIAWDDLQTVEALVRTGSVVGAARELGLRHSTVSRRIDALERQLDASLFLRGRRLRPAPIATRIAERAAAMRGEAGTLEAELLAERRRRRDEVVLTTNDVLAPLLFRALRALPGSPRVTVRISDDESELAPGVVDLALRPGAQPRGALRGRRLGVVSLGIYRSRHGALDQWILPTAAMRRRASMRWWRVIPEDAVSTLTCSSYLAMRDACAAGLGRAALPAFLADGLVREAPLDDTSPIWLLSPPTRSAPRPLQQFSEGLFRELRQAKNTWAE